MSALDWLLTAASVIGAGLLVGYVRLGMKKGDHWMFKRCKTCGVRRGWCERCADD